jgi:hypothetical protein
MISKELLSEVYNFEIIKLQRLDDIRVLNMDFHGWAVRCKDSDDDFLITSLSELAHKCKEWAESKGYYMMSGTWALQDGKQKACIIGKPRPLETFIADTETEAIFKACEWILTNDTNI